jgi:trk system potassium uptake protein TrkA
VRILVYGCGELAFGTVRELLNDDNQITVLGSERGQLERFGHYENVRAVLMAEPVMNDYLMDAGISHAQVFLALSTDDHENLLAAQIAHRMFGINSVVCHVENPQLQVLYTTRGLNVLSYSVGILQDIRFAINTS